MHATAIVVVSFVLMSLHHATDCHLATVGTVALFAGSHIPYGWLACDGRSVAISEYPELYAVLDVQYRTADNLPMSVV